MCDTLVRVLSDRVLFAKNSDREADEPQQIVWEPRRSHPTGAEVRCTWIAIPQVATTYALILSRPIWMWGAEMGTNEHGVTIGNEAVFTRAAVPAIGLTGMDLLRLALERGATAQEAMQVIVALHEKHGQGGGCGYEDRNFRYHSSFLIADGREAYVLETAGRAWASEKVVGARSISNGLTIPGFAEAHSDRLKTRISACRLRRARTESRARSASELGDLAAALRDHGETEWPRYAFLNGALNAPCVHAGGAAVSSQTTASWIAELFPSALKNRHFVTGSAAPCISLFKPVLVHEPLDLGPAPTATPDDSLFWQHERLHRATMRNPARLAPLFLGERDALERKFLSGAVSAQRAWDESRAALGRFTAHVLEISDAERLKDVRPRFARRFWQARRS